MSSPQALAFLDPQFSLWHAILLRALVNLLQMDPKQDRSGLQIDALIPSSSSCPLQSSCYAELSHIYLLVETNSTWIALIYAVLHWALLMKVYMICALFFRKQKFKKKTVV